MLKKVLTVALLFSVAQVALVDAESDADKTAEKFAKISSGMNRAWDKRKQNAMKLDK